MERIQYIKPEIEITPYREPLMYIETSTGGSDSFARENDTFFKDDEEDDELWSDFVPFEEEE